MALAVLAATDLLGQFLSGADQEEQRRLQEEARAIYGDASPPNLERLLRERMGPSELEALPQEFGNRDVRNAALEQLVQMGLAGGMDPGSQLALEQARRAGAQQAAQGQAAVRQEFQRRGLGGAGEATLALQAQQAGADRAALGGLQEAADARSRALQALATGGNMAAQAEAQDFSQAARRAEGLDAFNRFNTQMILDAAQGDWTNRVGLMDRRYGATMNAAGQAGQNAANTQRRVGAYGQVATDALSSITGNLMPAPGSLTNQQGPPPAKAQGYDPNDPRFRKVRP